MSDCIRTLVALGLSTIFQLLNQATGLDVIGFETRNDDLDMAKLVPRTPSAA